MATGARAVWLALLLSASWAGCKDPFSNRPQAVVTGLILTPTGEPFGGAEVVARVWVDPPACIGETPWRFVTESQDDGSFVVLVFGRRDAMQEDACVVVSGIAPRFIPGSTGHLPTTLRVEGPLDTVTVEIVLGNFPPP